jgi:hypothetical protein
MINFLLILLMCIPTLLAVAGLTSVIIGEGSQRFFNGMKFQLSAGILQLAYAFLIAIPLEWNWMRLSTAFMLLSGAYMWKCFGDAAKRNEIESARHEARYQEMAAKKIAKDLELPWVDVLTAEREHAKLLADLEKTYLEGKQNGS